MDWVDLYDWIQTVTPERLPAAPFALAPHVTVVDPARWLAWLQSDARIGPTGPRARHGALQDDMRRVYELVEL